MSSCEFIIQIDEGRKVLMINQETRQNELGTYGRVTPLDKFAHAVAKALGATDPGKLPEITSLNLTKTADSTADTAATFSVPDVAGKQNVDRE